MARYDRLPSDEAAPSTSVQRSASKGGGTSTAGNGTVGAWAPARSQEPFPDGDDDIEIFGISRGDNAETLALIDAEIEEAEEQVVRTRRRRGAAPWFAYPLLVAAVLAVSSAGMVFASMRDVPALTLAAWRLQLTTALLMPAAAKQLYDLPRDLRRRCWQQGWLLASSGAFLAVHFGAWVWSIEHTSLAHSLLFVSASPLIIAAGTWLLRLPISKGELGGTALGFLGALLLVQGTRSGTRVTASGDLAALAASVAVIGYLLIGRALRAWMPAFVYAAAVTGVAAVLLLAAAWLVDGATLLGSGAEGLFGWAASDLWWRVVYLALGPGIVGHTGFNWLLRYLKPLVISLAITLEPLLGTLMGWAILRLAAPDAWTYVGGGLLLLGTVTTTIACHKRERLRASKRQAAIALDEVFSRDGRSSVVDDAW